MERRAVGSSGLTVSPVMFGAWAIGGLYWGGSDDAVSVAALRASFDAGINAIDTAAIYGYGRSERVVGEAIRGRRHEVVIATKCSQPWDDRSGQFSYRMVDDTGTERTVYRNLRPESVARECEASLRRLGIETIVLYQCHVWDGFSNAEVIVDSMLRLREQGKIRAFGLSGFPFEVLKQCIEAGPVASYQPRFNILDREIEEDVLPFCREHGVAVLVYSPLERGLLSGRMPADRTFAPGDQRLHSYRFNEENRRRIAAVFEELAPIAERHGATIAQMMINWTIQVPGITAALVGARTPEQARENAGAMSFLLTPDERRVIEEAFASFEWHGQPERKRAA